MKNLKIFSCRIIILALLICDATNAQNNSIVPINNSIAKSPIWVITLKDSTLFSKVTFDSLDDKIVYIKTGEAIRIIDIDLIFKIEIERQRLMWPVMGFGALIGMLVEIGAYNNPPPDENGVVHNSGFGFLNSRMISIITQGFLGGLIGLFCGAMIDKRDEYEEEIDFAGRREGPTEYLKIIFSKTS